MKRKRRKDKRKRRRRRKYIEAEAADDLLPRRTKMLARSEGKR